MGIASQDLLLESMKYALQYDFVKEADDESLNNQKLSF